MEKILENSAKKIIMLANEAIVRGALEAGVKFVSTYPGTPASEIGNIFSEIAKKAGVYFEFSTNEKVALEAGIGASFSGLKTLVAMKSFGLNVCLDALLPFAYTGVKGPTVIIVADDPSCHSSAQSEENIRPIAFLSHIPIIEPSDSQECKDFTKLAFQISEKFGMPVMVRTTTRVAHQRMPVILGKIPNPKPLPRTETKFLVRGEIPNPEFQKDPKRWVTLPPRVLEMKKELLEKIEKIKEFSEKSRINKVENPKSENSIGVTYGNSDFGVIASGVSYLYVKEALNELNLKLPVLKLGFFYPLPEKKIKDFIQKFKKVLVVEELEPYLEKEVQRLSKNVNPKLQIFGKNLLPEIGELKPEMVVSAILKITNSRHQAPNYKFTPTPEFGVGAKFKIPKRYPRLCPGCPYWLVFSAIKKAVDAKEVIFGGDIGCYMLFGTPALNIQDYLSCMGSSIGIAHGIKKAAGQKLIAFIGDSTFIHAGIPALINTVFNKSNPLIIILDNQTTAMTGHQPHPGIAERIDSQYKFGFTDPDFSKFSEGCLPAVKIEEIVKACGVKNLKVIDPINQEEFIKAVKDFLEKEEVSVIISRRICAILAKRLK